MIQLNHWQIRESEFPGSEYAARETVFTTGNGYFCSRGSFEERYPGETATTFVHGVFNDVPVYGTELVNFPTWFALKIILDGEIFRLDHGVILNYERSLNLANGLLSRRVRWESPEGRQFSASFERYADMADIHHACLRFNLSDFNFEGQIQIQSPLSGTVLNENYRHWHLLDQGRIGGQGCFIELATSETQIRAAMAQNCSIHGADALQQLYWDAERAPTVVYDLIVHPGDKIDGIKDVTLFTARESPSPKQDVIDHLTSVLSTDPSERWQQHQSVWQSLWDRSNVTIEGDDRADSALRYNLFQILIAAPRHDDRVSIGAKTLSGYGYRGHVFWDTEIFILPFLTYTQPEIARNLLLYRYHTLAGAREKAKKAGYAGAMFAWESAGTGKEVTPTWVTGAQGELIRIWCGDLEQHITADVVYGVSQYWKATGDDAFMQDFGVEIVLSGAQFYASRLEWSPETGHYHIRKVLGPDENHENVNDNAMTNLMAAWTLDYARGVARWLAKRRPEKYADLMTSLSLTEEHVLSWEEMSRKIWVHVRADGVIEQFEGFFDLDFIEQAELDPREQSLQSLFGIEGVQKYQFIKQPDVVMAQFLLRDQFTADQIKQNMAYYSPRTDLRYGSSLGPSIEAIMLARYGDVEKAYDLFMDTLMMDLENNRGNTQEGIHSASAGAVWQVMLFGFLGFEIEKGLCTWSPRLPVAWERVVMNVNINNDLIMFDNF